MPPIRPHTAVAGALALLLSGLAEADEGVGAPPSGPVDWSTLAYDPPEPVYRLRLGLEMLGAVTAAYVGYRIQDPPPSVPGVAPTPIWKKLTFQPGTWVFDADDFGTNLAGHAAAGTAYYLIARGNRASIAESFLWTFGASMLWELVEQKEPVSINDSIVTPGAGLAIGEGLSQLSAWFDRSGSDPFSKAMAWVFNPAKKLHDWIDGATPSRDPRALGWHEFRALVAGGALTQSASATTYLVTTLAVDSRLFHAPGPGRPGKDRFSFHDGNASRFGVGFTFTGSQVVDFLFDTETVLAGLYLKDLTGPEEAPEGWEILVGGTAGYEYGMHRWDLRTGETDHVALVRLPGLTIRPRLSTGGTSVALDLDASLVFGGVVPFALSQPAWFPPGSAFPPVLTAQGYTYDLGLRLAPAVMVEHGPVAIGGAASIDLLTALTGPNVVSVPGQMVQMSDRRSLVSAWGRWRFADPRIEVALTFQWRARSGTAGEVSASAEERSTMGSLGVLF